MAAELWAFEMFQKNPGESVAQVQTQIFVSFQIPVNFDH